MVKLGTMLCNAVIWFVAASQVVWRKGCSPGHKAHTRAAYQDGKSVSYRCTNCMFGSISGPSLVYS
jgi:hypothetical protein